MAQLSLVFLFLPVSFFLGQVDSRAVNISTTWTLPQEGYRYFFRYFHEHETWDNAKTICNSFNAQLLTVETDERRDAAKAYLKELDVLDSVWIGLHRYSGNSFGWDGDEFVILEGEGDWEIPNSPTPDRLCVAMLPLYDFGWQSYPCDSSQKSSFVCQLEVPQWAEKCLVKSLPSLTVTYLPEPSVIELLSDCGLAGTTRIACKPQQDTADLMKLLSCDPYEDSPASQHSSTQGYTTKTHHGSSEFITTRSSNTRHKRESNPTSTSTDTSIFSTEPEIKMERVPVPDPMSPVDAITIIAEYAKEDQIEETTVSVIDQTKDTLPPIQSTGHNSHPELRPPTIDATSRLTVKTWMAEINDELAQLSTSSQPPSPSPSTTTKLVPTVNPITSTSAQNTQSKIEIPPTTVTPEHTTIIPVTAEKDSRMPHPPFIQFREKPTTKPPTTTTTEKTPTTEELAENGLGITTNDSNTTEHNIFAKETNKIIETSSTEVSEQSTETIPAQTSDSVPETARPATINTTNDAEPKNTVTETLTKINTEEATAKPDESPISEEASEENPKRSSRGRLFPHSNPLSFYPYFLNKVLG